MRLHKEPIAIRDAISITTVHLKLLEIYIEKDYCVTLAIDKGASVYNRMFVQSLRYLALQKTSSQQKLPTAMTLYEQAIQQELHQWQQKMQKQPSAANRLTKSFQARINRIIPNKVHEAITATIKQMTRGVLYGAGFTTRVPATDLPLQSREAEVRDRIRFYKTTGATEGALTGAGGFWLALADFPLLLGIKMKMLFEIAALYGYPIDDYRERVFILHVFQLAFSSQERRRELYRLLETWDEHSKLLPDDINQFDWLTFQLEYRDYIDLAKMAQLIPGVGAAVGLVVNYRLLNSLGTTAMNAYRMRWLEAKEKKLPPSSGRKQL